MSTRRTSRLTLLYSLAIAVVLFVTINLLAGLRLASARFDLTEDKLFTVSEGTRQTLRALDEPLHLRFFYSGEEAVGYPILQSYAQRIKGLLRQYEILSRGKLTVEVIDPRPYTEEEDQAIALGIKPIPLDESGTKLFFGMSVTNAVDETLPIAFFDPSRQPFLEYDITRAIDRLKASKQTTLGILSWLPMRGNQQSFLAGEGPWVIFTQLKQFFNVEVLDTEVTAIPSNIDVLMVAHPAAISPATAYALDQYVLKGGKLLLLLDPHIEIAGMPEKASTLPPLMKAWGITMSTSVAADPQAALTVQTEQGVTSLGQAPNVTWLQLEKPNFNQDEVATASLKILRMATVGAFARRDEQSLRMTPLVTTGESAFTVNPLKLMFAEQDPTLLMKEMTPAEHPLNLAVRLSGIARTAFPDYEATGHLAQSKESVNIVAIGDTDFLRDGFWVRKQKVFGNEMFSPNADNGSFVLNLIDYLSGDPALIGLRTRSTDDRAFTVVKKLRSDAEARFRDEEEGLRQRVGEIEQGLQRVQGEEGGKALLNDEQQADIARFRDEMLSTRQQLRGVRHALEEKIESLGFKLKLINIGLMPLLVLLLALFLPRRLGMKRS